MTNDTLALHVRALAERAKNAARRLAASSDATRTAALARIADGLDSAMPAILAANARDVAEANTAVARGELPASARDRLILDEATVRGMAAGVRAVAALSDPIGIVRTRTRLDDHLILEQRIVPLGVIAAIFESRPDAVPQIVGLAVKSGNAVLLKGGSEAEQSVRAIVDVVHDALRGDDDVPADAIAILDGRAAVDAVLALDDLVDLVIPRGSKALVRSVQSRTRIPVLGHADGVCHVYVHASADAAMARRIVIDAKTQYPAACNAAETLLIDRVVVAALLPELVGALRANGVTVLACETARAIVPELAPATDDDWRTEYGDLTIAVRVVDGVDAAIAHVNRYGSHHTDTIVASDSAAVARFLADVDSAGVFHNASTRFADGYRYGFGAEVGVSTNKLHARGPVGLAGLTTYKYVLRGDGQIVADYAGPDARSFRHEPMS